LDYLEESKVWEPVMGGLQTSWAENSQNGRGVMRREESKPVYSCYENKIKHAKGPVRGRGEYLEPKEGGGGKIRS